MIFAALVYTTLSSAIVSSLGMLLVPTIADEMAVTTSTAQWILTINLLVGAVATPLLGRAVDGSRQRPVLVGVLVVVVVGSVVAALATEFTMFLVGRALQGVVYGVPSIAIAIARRHMSPARLQQRVPILAVTVSLGLGLGYPITGAFVSWTGHAAAFWFAAGFATTAIVVALLLLPRSPRPSPGHSFDVAGAALLSVGLGALLLVVSEGAHWDAWTVVAASLGAVLAMSAWVIVELRRTRPLVELRLFRHGDVLVANATALAMGVATYILLSLASVIAQTPPETGFGIGLSPIVAGLVILPYSAGALVMTFAIRGLARRLGMAALLPISAVLLVAAAAAMLLGHRSFEVLLGAMLLLGAGTSGLLAAMPTLIVSRVPAAEVGSAVGLNQVIRMVGSSSGSSIVAAVLALHLGPAGRPTSSGIDVALSIATVLCVMMALVLAVRAIGGSRRGGLEPPRPDLPI